MHGGRPRLQDPRQPGRGEEAACEGEDIIITIIVSIDYYQLQTPDPSTGYHTTREVREWDEEGDVMVLHLQVRRRMIIIIMMMMIMMIYQIPAKPDLICKRVYKRVVEQPEEISAPPAEEQ